ncbi:BON domain-containing protein [Salinicola rhizosphaerae]|uniref:BON domain-containing protein n=1 Tax=Salinicola rhizosphaerae TaxID=1443141 RepID=A0ABQ3E9K4_9GAMM|nr:BON domain-containing protein [Salinicola rhizosphaerae]GHB31049.1 BON domain-containing protein [Salinicola rhizosphaerae]
MKKTLIVTSCLIGLLTLGGCASNATQENYAERTPGAKAEDSTIQSKIFDDLNTADARYGDAHINVDSYNSNVLLTGQVPSDELKSRATDIARNVRSVREVHNELSVSANTPVSQRMTDTWITGRIKANLIANEDLDANLIRVITENSTVYLMGMVTQQQAQQIVNAASGVGGVQRIVKVFEYLN